MLYVMGVLSCCCGMKGSTRQSEPSFLQDESFHGEGKRKENEDHLEKEDLPAVNEDHVEDHLKYLKVHKSMGPNEIHPQVLRERVDEFAKPLSIIFERSWQSDEVPTVWKRENIASIFKDTKKKIHETTGHLISPL